MSKLSEAIKAQQLDRRAPPIGRIAPIVVSDEHVVPPAHEFTIHRAYRIKVELGVNATLPDGDVCALKAAMTRSRRMICEEVFGEFREPIYRIEVALMDHDEVKAMELLHELKLRMFEN